MDGCTVTTIISGKEYAIEKNVATEYWSNPSISGTYMFSGNVLEADVCWYDGLGESNTGTITDFSHVTNVVPTTVAPSVGGNCQSTSGVGTISFSVQTYWAGGATGLIHLNLAGTPWTGTWLWKLVVTSPTLDSAPTVSILLLCDSYKMLYFNHLIYI